MVRIPACHAGGRGFESRPLRQRIQGRKHLLHVGAFFSSRLIFQSRVFRSKVRNTRLSGWLESRTMPSFPSLGQLKEYRPMSPVFLPLSLLIYAPKWAHITLCALSNTYSWSTTSDVQTPHPLLGATSPKSHNTHKFYVITETLEEAEGTDWWDSVRIPADIKADVASLAKRERDNGVTPRSDDMIDYTTFGQLSGMITSNWDLCQAHFKSEPLRAGLRKVNLNQ